MYSNIGRTSIVTIRKRKPQKTEENCNETAETLFGPYLSFFLEQIHCIISKQVTYKWLGRTLSVASNTAKQMLYAFLLKEKEKKSNSLTATYLVGGRCKVDDQLVHQYVLTSDDKLEETKNKFECITSVHVYSLQKKTPKDINTLYTVDYEIHQEHKEEPNKWSHIYCKEAKKLSDGGVSRGTFRGKQGKENAVPKPEMTNGLGSSSSVTDNAKSKPSNQRPKKGQLPTMGMFAVKNEKKPDQPKPDEPISNSQLNKSQKPPKPVEKAKPSGMMSFFGKQISEPTRSKPETKEDPKPKEVEEKKEEKTEEKKIDDHKVIKETPENKQKPNKPTKQGRKRIKNLASSDEEEEEDPFPKSLKKLVSDSESEEEIKPSKSNSKNPKEKEKEVQNKKKTKKKATKKGKEATPDEAKDKTKTNRKRKKQEKEESSEEDSINSKSDSTVVSETTNPSQRPDETSTKRRKRRKVMKSKTYVDDDGFMVTEKVYESESTDASDEEVIENKQDQLFTKDTSPDSKPKKQHDLKPVKQASLMSFFRKN